MPVFDCEEITQIAAAFIARCFELSLQLETELYELLRDLCKASWNLSNPNQGSGKRALLFVSGQVDWALLKSGAKLAVVKALQEKRMLFPHEFCLFMDPDGCSANFSWGVRSTDEHHVEIYPKNDWGYFCDKILSRKAEEGLKVSISRLPEDASLADNIVWMETAQNIPSHMSDSVFGYVPGQQQCVPSNSSRLDTRVSYAGPVHGFAVGAAVTSNATSNRTVPPNYSMPSHQLPRAILGSTSSSQQGTMVNYSSESKVSHCHAQPAAVSYDGTVAGHSSPPSASRCSATPSLQMRCSSERLSFGPSYGYQGSLPVRVESMPLMA